MTSPEFAELKTQMDRIETLVARLVDRVLVDDVCEVENFNPTLLARDILARGPAAMKEHNQRRKRRQS